MLNGKSVLITGGTGTLGNGLTERILKKYDVNQLLIFSRDEFKQHKMKQKFSNSKLRFIIGDVRDEKALESAVNGVDYIIHTAALKHVPQLEYNPLEAVQTNIQGSSNLIRAAVKNNVKKVIGISSDKAVAPINLYGLTKAVMEKLFVWANSYDETIFTLVRYGNVANSRGSLIPIFLNLLRNKNEKLPVTDVKATRFWITLDQAIDTILYALEHGKGGEIIIPKMRSFKIVDLAEIMAGRKNYYQVGLRAGEKLHEMIWNQYESVANLSRYYILYSIFHKDKRYSLLPRHNFYSNENVFMKKHELAKRYGELHESIL